MAVLTRAEQKEFEITNCFRCRKSLDDQRFVWWEGWSEERKAALSFSLHARCAADMALHLAADALNADKHKGTSINR